MKNKLHALFPLIALFLASCSSAQPSSSSAASSSTAGSSSTPTTSSSAAQSSAASSQESASSASQSSVISSQDVSSSESQSSAESSESISSSSEASSQTSEDSSEASSSESGVQHKTYAPITTQTMPTTSADFIYGMDASAVPSLENSGVKYYDQENNEKDVFQILSENGVNTIRVRVWNDPFDADGHGYGGGNCDINNAVAIGKRATQYGMKLLVDFHYSDFWADPMKQKAPKAWSNYTFDQKSDAIYNFTKDSLQTLKDEGVDVRMVQIGNETNNAFLCGVKNDWEKFATFINRGSQATREVYPDALVAVHFTNPEKNGRLAGYAQNLSNYNVDYDVFGTSFYPYWHGTLSNLSSVLGGIASTYGKRVMVMETSYAYTTNDTDYHGNTSPKGSDVTPQPISIQGQYDQIYDVIDTMTNTTGGLGVCYWEGTWISVNAGSWANNSALWEEYGSGWASSYAGEYDPDDAGQWYGGCAVDNQAFFDERGKALPSIQIWNHEEGGDPVDPPVENHYAIAINGIVHDEIDITAPAGNDKAYFEIELEASDVVGVTFGGVDIPFAGYNGIAYAQQSNTFVAEEGGNHLFYVTTSDEIWVVKPIDTSGMMTVDLWTKFSIPSSALDYAAYAWVFSTEGGVWAAATHVSESWESESNRHYTISAKNPVGKYVILALFAPNSGIDAQTAPASIDDLNKAAYASNSAGSIIEDWNTSVGCNVQP